MTAVIFLMILIFISVAWNGYKKYQLRKFQLNFIHLSEDLDNLVKANKLKIDSRFYTQTKQVLLKTINNLENIHIWSVLAIRLTHKINEDTIKEHSLLVNEIANNKEAMDIYNKFNSTFLMYIIHKHAFLLIVFALGLKSIVISSKKYKQCKEYLADSVYDFPDKPAYMLQ